MDRHDKMRGKPERWKLFKCETFSGASHTQHNKFSHFDILIYFQKNKNKKSERDEKKTAKTEATAHNVCI